MTPDEIIREGRGLLEEPTGSIRFIGAIKRVLCSALGALDDATKRLASYEGDVTASGVCETCLRVSVKRCDEATARASRAEAALAKAEAERDEARRMYCRERSRACPHVVARETWSAAAERLFPKEG